MKINEIISHGAFPELGIDYTLLQNKLLSNPERIIPVQENLSIYITSNNTYHALVKNNSTVLGFLTLSDVKVNNNSYTHIDLIYVLPAFRNSKTVQHLIYYVKEHSKNPIIADGAIFKGGQNIIQSLAKHRLAKVSILNKNTGEKTPFTSLIDDLDSCYIFESTLLGAGKQLLPPPLPFTWYPPFTAED